MMPNTYANSPKKQEEVFIHHPASPFQPVKAALPATTSPMVTAQTPAVASGSEARATDSPEVANPSKRFSPPVLHFQR